MIVLICGDRDWDDVATINNFLALLPDDTIIVHGDCRGADKIAGRLAENGTPRKEVIPYPADWEKYGRAAGPIRNSEMLKKARPNLVVAFHNNITASKGTKDMLKKARAEHIPAFIISNLEGIE